MHQGKLVEVAWRDRALRRPVAGHDERNPCGTEPISGHRPAIEMTRTGSGTRLRHFTEHGHFPGACRDVRAPSLHQGPTLVAVVAPGVGPFGGVRNTMGECRFHDRVRRRGAFSRPSSERCPKTVNRCPVCQSDGSEHLRQGRIAKGLAWFGGGREHQVRASFTQFVGFIQDQHRGVGKRHHVVHFRFHAFSRNPPFPCLKINFGPPGTSGLTASRRSQDHPPQAQLGCTPELPNLRWSSVPR